MNRTGSLFIAFGMIAAGVALVVDGPWRSRQVHTVAVAGSSFPSSSSKVVIANSSCSAPACHGGPAATSLISGKHDVDAWKSSASYWSAVDPHATAYSLLTDSPRRPVGEGVEPGVARPVRITARQIMARLAGHGRTPLPATEDARCLACHTDPRLAGPTSGIHSADRLASLRSDGVGCQACHGSADDWLVSHTTWKERNGPHYAASGMTPLIDAKVRAETCAGCHIGAPADPARGVPLRDMNHDMIAAGHPALNFDFAEYNRRLPKHWHEQETWSETRAWVVGQFCQTEAATELLADRARRAKEGSAPWPEFGDFRCVSCHQTLAENRGLGKFSIRPASVIMRSKPTMPAEWSDLELVMRADRPADPAAVEMSARKALVGLRKLGTQTQAIHGERLAREWLLLPDRDDDPESLTQRLHGFSARQRDWNRGVPMVMRHANADFSAAYRALEQKNWTSLARELDRLGRLLQQMEDTPRTSGPR